MWEYDFRNLEDCNTKLKATPLLSKLNLNQYMTCHRKYILKGMPTYMQLTSFQTLMITGLTLEYF